MQALIQQFHSVNIATYPACVQQLLASYRIQCFRRAIKKHKVAQYRLVLVMARHPLLAGYPNTIRADAVNVHYDHVVYVQEEAVAGLLLKKAKTVFLPELYTVNIQKETRTYTAPAGQFFAVPAEHLETVLQAISRWFAAGEVFFCEGDCSAV